MRRSLSTHLRSVALVLSLLGLILLGTESVGLNKACAQSSTAVFAGTGKASKRREPYADSNQTIARNRIALGNPFGIEIVGDQWWVTSVDDQCIYRGSLNGETLTRVAGNGLLGYGGDGETADQATFNWPHEVRVDATGNLFVADTRNHVIRQIEGETNVVTTVAGNGTAGFAGDGQRGKQVQFRQPHSVVLDGRGGLLVADTGNHRIRRIELETGIVTTISGTGQKKLPKDRTDAAEAPLFGPRSLAVDNESIWIALREGNSIWRIDRETNLLHHVAGTGEKGYSGDGGDPRLATFKGPKGLVVDDRGRVLVVDTENHAIRRIDLESNRIETVLGGSRQAETLTLKRPHGIAFHPEIGFLVGDSESHRVVVGR
ncbi:MAG: hypothetical protein AAGG48_20745 [Planctomycetota bacterium]